MKKLITALLFATTTALGSVYVTSSFVEDQYHYDLDVTLDFQKYVSAPDFLGPGADEGTKLFYELTTIKPSETATYTFNNYASDIAVGSSKIYETQLLLYTQYPSEDYIIDEPWAFRTSDYGFGAGYVYDSANEAHGGGAFNTNDLVGFTGDLYLEKDVEYIAVFTSFVPDAYGTLDVSVVSDYSMQFGAVPEPSTYSLLLGFGVFMYVAVRKRNASKKDIR